MGGKKRALLVRDIPQLEEIVSERQNFSDSRMTSDTWFMTDLFMRLGFGSKIQRYTFNGKLEYQGDFELTSIGNGDGGLRIGEGTEVDWEKKPMWKWGIARGGPALMISYDAETWDIYAKAP